MTFRTVLEAIGILIGAIMLWMVLHKPAPAPVNIPAIATKSPELASVATTVITPTKVIVYAPDAKRKLNLPSSAQTNDSIAVLDSSKINSGERPQTVTTVIDATTGKPETFVTVDPYPWLAVINEKEIRLSYGFKNGAVKVGRIALSDDLVTIKGVRLGANGSLDTDGRFFVGAGISYRW